MKKHIILILCLFVLPITLLAHGDEHAPLGVVSAEYLESSIAVLKGVGTYKDQAIVSSLPAGAQQDLALTYTKQGIALDHAFQWEDSVRSFNEALRLDPNLSRAHVGYVAASMNLVDPNSNSLEFVPEHMTKAASSALAVQDNEVDRIWVDFYNIYLGAQFGSYLKNQNLTLSTAAISSAGKGLAANLGLKAKLVVLLDALIALEDPEAYAFKGWDLGMYTLLDSAVVKFPNHSGILHYLTHVYENSSRYQQAAEFAKRTITEAPDTPHLIHMYGHILPLLGQWEEANKFFLKAHCIHKAVLRQAEPLCAGQQFEAAMSSVTPTATEFWHYGHNLELYSFSLMRSQHQDVAEKMFNELCAIGACDAIVKYYLGQERYADAIAKVDQLGPNIKTDSANPLFQLKVQALIGQKKIQEAVALFNQTTNQDIDAFASYLDYGFATNSLKPDDKAQLTQYLAQVTANPNFDTWSHVLPILRSLYFISKQYNAPEAAELYAAINKIDPGHIENK